jgi:adenosylhomocysteine nucleosidase
MRSLPWGRRAGIVTGLQAEAQVAARFARTRAGGGLPEGAAEAARALVAEGVEGLISFGVCGALDPALHPGALVVPRVVIWHGRHYPTDEGLSQTLGGWSAETLLATEATVAAAPAKRALFTEYGAAGVDLESGAVADVALEAGLPFAVLRAVCDPEHLGLPPAALVALDPRGGISFRRLTASLLRRPGQIPALVTLGRAAAAARRALVGRVDEILAAEAGLVP